MIEQGDWAACVQVVMRRDRLCIPVKAGRQGELPRGSVALATSGSGATLYMEPAPLIPLNNLEASLRTAQQDEENAILATLSQLVRCLASSTLLRCNACCANLLLCTICHILQSRPVKIELEHLGRLHNSEGGNESGSAQVAANAVEIEAILQCITALDVATARAKHATWLQGSAPIFSPANDLTQNVNLLQVQFAP